MVILRPIMSDILRPQSFELKVRSTSQLDQARETLRKIQAERRKKYLRMPSYEPTTSELQSNDQIQNQVVELLQLVKTHSIEGDFFTQSTCNT